MMSWTRLAEAGLVATGLLLGACATVPPPTEQIAASRSAVESAEVAGAGRDAPADLAVADNATAAGRQQNRRVEIVFSDGNGQFAAR